LRISDERIGNRRENGQPDTGSGPPVELRFTILEEQDQSRDGHATQSPKECEEARPGEAFQDVRLPCAAQRELNEARGRLADLRTVVAACRPHGLGHGHGFSVFHRWKLRTSTSRTVAF